MKSDHIYLVDTGPIVALLDRKDPAHKSVRAAWEPLRGKFITTGAVITEAFYLLGDTPGGGAGLAAGLVKGHVSIADVFHPSDIHQASLLMEKYADTPMDFADATLVLLAGRLGIPRILTLDERGFRAFRYRKNLPFQLTIQDGD